MGLTSREAAKRLAHDGPNSLPQDEPRSLLRLLSEVVREPMFLLLLASAGLYLVFGDVREALTLLGFVVVIITITVVQEGRTERALEALRDLSSPRAQVLRDGEVVTVAGRDLVRGDIIRVAEGDRVAGDAILREGTTLAVDESLLTGESVPVTKAPDAALDRPGTPGGDGGASLFSGTLVVGGRGVAEVVATGPRSELGKIGASLRELKPGRTSLQREVDVVVRRTAVVGIGLSATLVLVRGLLEGEWLRGALSGITLAMALLPEEFPVVLTVFLALGARRIAQTSQVLTRRVAAVETLGAVHVLCTDKTGTLTENRMTIRRLRSLDADLDVATAPAEELPEAVHRLVEFGILACPRDPFDPMEKAFHDLGARTLRDTEHLHPRWEATREYPLTADLLAVTHAWRVAEEQQTEGAPEGPAPGSLVVATKGAPEAVFDLCHLDDDARAVWRDRAESMAREGLRVLGVARSTGRLTESPGHPHDLAFEMVGLVGLQDPVRPDVPDAVALCRRARIRILMITGDHPDTARAIARAAGIDSERVITGPQIDAMSDAELADALQETSIVARAVPAQKLRIVCSLKARGLISGMTGDGVNDAPALKAADIGIAMGARGTDVAREAAGLVLVNDDFGAIVQAVRIGRRIYDNLRKAISYIVAVHIPIAGLSLLPALLGWGAVMAPAHVVFLELIIDPSCSIVFEMEPEESDVMDRPPRAANTRLFDWTRITWSLLLGAVSLGSTMGLLAWGRAQGASLEALRSMAFVALVLGNLAILLASRSATLPFWGPLVRSRNDAVPILGGVALSVTAAVVLLPPLQALFSFAPLEPRDLGLAVAVGVLPVLVADAVKALLPRRASA
ncbi:MAG: cation-translocating P-type ATPase [Deltaproteobacteria bacterium]|nr:cation-translocating P-type ATPase [Deltaproteobacteria bacterium]